MEDLYITITVGNVCAKVVDNNKTNYVTENRAHGSSLGYANELINMHKCSNSTTEGGMKVFGLKNP